MSTGIASPWLTVLRAPSLRTRLNLICAPYAGGSSASFRTWPARLPESIAVFSIELPGRGKRFSEPCATSIEQIVPPILESLSPLMDRPFTLLGHSLGALIAFEIVHRLADSYRPLPTELILSGQRALHCPGSRPPIHGLGDEDFVSEIQRFGGTPQGLFENEELRAVFLPVLRADITLGETYTAARSQPLNVPVRAYGGWEDEEVQLSDLQAWSSYTRASFQYRMFPGNHFFLHQHETLFLEALSSDLLSHLA